MIIMAITVLMALCFQVDLAAALDGKGIRQHALPFEPNIKPGKQTLDT